MPPRRYQAPPDREAISIEVGEQVIEAYMGEPVAAAMLGAGLTAFSRSVKYHRPRGAPCGAGHCAHCLMRIDGLPNRAACQTPCRPGLRAAYQNVVGSARHDLLGVTDWFFPRGIDHHELFTGVPLVQGMVQKIVRKLAGLGTLPEAVPASRPIRHRRTEVLVVGGGASGLAAFEAVLQAGREAVLLEAADTLGGRLRSVLWERPPALPGQVELQSTAEFLHRPRGTLEVVASTPAGIVRWHPEVVVLATGTYPSPGLFANNDLPGIFDAYWAAELMSRFGVLPCERPVLCAGPELSEPLEALFRQAGAEIAATLPPSAALRAGSPRILEARGSASVEALRIEGPGGTETVEADGLVLGLPRAPAFELAVQAGAETRFDPAAGGFVVCTDEAGQVSPGVFACGSLCAAASPEAAAESGRRVGRAAAEAVEGGSL
ncbi:MAG: pyridine nucleotide-disulfide oxidoreductase [Deltaproteobacteria bacterium]|nr:MAG: pyridine nucleotide-disulfide oxidoreductase [Deltaproteobacteria bacterium]